ncbi:MAG: CoA ester lyase [Bacilli bacterium]|nr:CoA ester lyase [Acholeplasmataceae bacterium]
MRRSLLFIPANRPGMLQNADVFDADGIIFDLEDSVALNEKDSARILLRNFLDSFKFEFEVIVRINPIDHVNGILDLEAIISPAVEAIMLPKSAPAMVKKLGELLEGFEKARGIKKTVKIIPLIELAKSVLEMEEIACLPRVDAMMLGAEDLSSDMEMERTKAGDEIFYPRAKLAYVCRAFGIDSVDTPFTDVLDEEGLCADARRAKGLGLTGKSAIHPNQIRFINDIFSPSKAQIDWALKVLETAKQHSGAFSLDGKMIDRPIIARCEKILEKGKKWGLL